MTERGDPTLTEAIGKGVRIARLRRGMRQDELAGRVRVAGLSDWTRTVVAKAERGERALPLEELLLLSLALRVSVSELVVADGWIALTPDARAHVRAVRAALEGVPLAEADARDLEFPDLRELPQIMARVHDSASAAYRQYLWIWPEMDFMSFLEAASEGLGEAEQKAAAKLGVTPLVVAVAARRRWGISLTQERDGRVDEQILPDAPPRTLQALRGHVTRELVEELRLLLDEASRNQG